MCDGPAEYAGETAQNLELLPPLKRQTGSIVNVAMPFATNVVTNELIGLMNIGMRYVTTGDVQTLRPAADTDAPVTKLRPRTYKEVIVPTARPLADPDTVVTLDAMARVSEALRIPLKRAAAPEDALAASASPKRQSGQDGGQ